MTRSSQVKMIALTVATMMVFVCGLRWKPISEEPFRRIFLYTMCGGLVGSVLIVLRNLGTPNNPSVIRREMIHCTYHGGGRCVRQDCSGFRIN